MIKGSNKKIKLPGSLYLGLILNIFLAILAAVVMYILAITLSTRYINYEYLARENQQQRRDNYLRDLQSFVTSRGLTFDEADRISEWARANKYVYLLVQKDDQLLYPSDAPELPEKNPESDKNNTQNGTEDGTEDGTEGGGTEGGNGEDGTEDGTEGGDTEGGNTEGGAESGADKENNKEDNKNDNENTGTGGGTGIGDVIGGFTESRPSREELIAAAQANGLHEIEMVDGTIFVSLTEYSQTLYLEISRLLSLVLAAAALAIVLINYFRIIIRRIKRLENDVNIVSHEDMNHVIVGKGNDELTNLSRNVEVMRNTMLENLKNEQEAREANTELITSISHDIRTPLTVLMGYVEMMKNHDGSDETMQRYIAATETTAQRLKQLSDDMFRYSLAFGDAKKGITLEEYDARTLLEQLFSEHILLLREQGFEISNEQLGEGIREGSTVRTDAQNLMRIVDNIFSNLSKYADKDSPINITVSNLGDEIRIEFINKIRADGEVAESNGIGLKTCVRLASLIAKKFEYQRRGELFMSCLTLNINDPKTEKSARTR